MNAPANTPISEQFRVVAKKWCEADAAASLLEDTKSAFLAQKISEQGDMPHNRAETTVKSSPEWADYIKTLTDARKQANLLKVQMEYIRMQFSEWQSHNANKRAEMRL